MKNPLMIALLAVTLASVGCKEQNTASAPTQTPSKAQGGTPGTVPVAQAALTAWEQGNPTNAVNSFVLADWSARPLFAPDSVLSLTEEQFRKLSSAEQQAKMAEALKEVDTLKRLATAVSQAGGAAASNGDATRAHACFQALKQCGAALSGPDSLSLVQLVGKAFTKMADAELAKISK